MDRLVFATGPIAREAPRKKPRREFARMLTDALSAEVVVVVASSYAELGGLVERGEADVAWLPPALYVRIAEAGRVSLLLGAERAGGARFHGALFVAAESEAQTIEDLEGARIAWVDHDSCSGYLFPRLALVDRGLQPATFFARELVLGSHDAVARAVAVRSADVGATFVDGLDERARRTGWALEVEPDAMRPILTSAPIPADTICAVEQFYGQRRADLVGTLLDLHESAAGAEVLAGLFGVDRFVEAEESDYDTVRRALRETP